ncbi:pentapeptide repeat-containing protein [uncultured Nostoc sp.]|uniref:pentapeptide repeat-containing protein n=1 Tax=uncultured Nostoc sp. TaxID=340711 RepID=UPI0035CA3A7F
MAANLSEANLSRANLSYARLSLVRFIGTNLEGANVTDADIIGAIFENANLKRSYLSDFGYINNALFQNTIVGDSRIIVGPEIIHE